MNIEHVLAKLKIVPLHDNPSINDIQMFLSLQGVSVVTYQRTTIGIHASLGDVISFLLEPNDSLSIDGISYTFPIPQKIVLPLYRMRHRSILRKLKHVTKVTCFNLVEDQKKRLSKYTLHNSVGMTFSS
jgi:hypothetical protein